MTVNGWRRMVVMVGIGAVASLGLSVPVLAQPPPQNARQDQRAQEKADKRAQKDQEKQDRQARKQEQALDKQLRQSQQRQEQEQAARVRQVQQAQQRQPRQVDPREQQRWNSDRQQDAARQQQQRMVQYREHLDQQQHAAQQWSSQLQQQRRNSQFRAQQDYAARLRQQQARVQAVDRYDYYSRDASFYAPQSYRYARGGRMYQTSQYGVNLLQQAVNYGYQEGLRVGLADRQDRWASGYEDAYAYQDANYGYGGFYVSRDEYNNYFREGFRRGYDDGYGGRYQYGRYSNGRVTILGNVLSAIFTFEMIR